MATHYDHPQGTSLAGTSTGMIALAVLVFLVVAAVYMFSGSQTAHAPMTPVSEQAAPQTSTGAVTPVPATTGAQQDQAPAPAAQPAQ